MSANTGKVTLEDLLGPVQKTEEVFLASQNGKSLKIKSLTIGDLAVINAFNKSRKWDDDPYRTSIGIIQKGVVEPSLKYEDAERLSVDVATELVNKISELSGWTKTAQEQVTNLSEKTTVPT